VSSDLVYGCIDMALGVVTNAKGKEKKALIVLFAKPNPEVRLNPLPLLFFQFQLLNPH